MIWFDPMFFPYLPTWNFPLSPYALHSSSPPYVENFKIELDKLITQTEALPRVDSEKLVFEFEMASVVCSLSLVGKTISSIVLDIQAARSIIHFMWSFVVNLSIKEVDKNTFIFGFVGIGVNPNMF
ncbi:hypothetical protein SLA2020_409750 [Shorea laevis]